jgi:hypothetical protein
MSLPENPTIKVVFTGLMAFFFDHKKSECQVAMHNRAAGHKLRINVYKSTPGSTEHVLSIANGNGAVDAFEDSDIRLEVARPKETIRKYQNGPFTRQEDDDPNDFRWIIDIEGHEFHGRKLKIKTDVLSPILRMNAGLFYTAMKCPVTIIRKKDRTPRFQEVAYLMGANIYLDGLGSKADLIWGAGGKNSLSLKKEKDTTYKIQVLNDCPQPSSIDPTRLGDFSFYYDVFIVNDEEERFHVLPAGFEGVSFDDAKHPCGPVTGGQTTGL